MNSQIKFWVMLAVMAALTTAYFLFVFIPMNKKIDQAQASMVQTEQEINFSILRILQIPDMRKQKDQLKRTVEVLRKRILAPDSISSAMSQLNQLCAQYQVKLNTINFSTDSLMAKSRASGSASYESFELPVLLEFEGHFLDVGMMLEHVNRLPFEISFTDFNISAQERSDMLRCETRACVRVAISKNTQSVTR